MSRPGAQAVTRLALIDRGAFEGTTRNGGDGGRGGIRTHGELAPTPVFKTGALNRSATLPRLGRYRHLHEHAGRNTGFSKPSCALVTPVRSSRQLVRCGDAIGLSIGRPGTLCSRPMCSHSCQSSLHLLMHRGHSCAIFSPGSNHSRLIRWQAFPAHKGTGIVCENCFSIFGAVTF